MQTINSQEKEIYCIQIDRNISPIVRSWSQGNKNANIDDILSFKRVGNGHGSRFNNNMDITCSFYGLILGAGEDFNKEMDAKVATSPISSFKKVHFDPDCSFPRFKLSEKTSIKRCLSVKNADSCIITKHEFRSATGYYSKKHTDNRQTIRVYKSKSTDSYYVFAIIKDYPNMFINPSFHRDDVGYSLKNTYLNTLNKFHGADNYENILEHYVTKGFVKNDYEFVYEGPYMALNNNDFARFLRFQSYMIITYDTELDKFVGNSLEKIDKDAITQINKMFASKDQSVVGMGMKLLSNYNILDNACAIGSLIMDNYMALRNNSAFKSVGFQQVLKSLGIGSDLSPSSIHQIINTLYTKSTNEEDKALGREIVRQRMESDLQEQLEKFNKLYSSMKIDVTYEVK